MVMGLSAGLPNRKMLFQIWNRKVVRYRFGHARQSCTVRPSNAMNAGMVPAAGAHPSPSSAANTFGGDIGRL